MLIYVLISAVEFDLPILTTLFHIKVVYILLLIEFIVSLESIPGVP